MKKLFSLSFLAMFIFALQSCGGDPATTPDVAATDITGDEIDNSSKSRENIAVSTWEGQILTDEPAGKWAATIAFGEELTLLGDSSYSDSKKKMYEKVELADGKTGWVRQDLIQKKGKLGAVLDVASIYKRPGVSNITDEKVEPGELVVISETQDQWTQVTGKNDAAYKRKTGWLLGEGLVTTDEIDLAVAVMMSKAMSDKNPIKRKEALQAILDNSAYSSSKFITKVDELALNADPSANLGPDEAMITGNVVNVRSSTEIIETNKIFVVKAGDVVRIIEKGMMDEISGKADYWYKISFDGKEGWIFGSNTTRAIDQ